jgi:hypothetical protein
MKHFRKNQRMERAHQYRSMVHGLETHLEAGHRLEPEVVALINTARDALKRAADLLAHDREEIGEAQQRRAS